MSEENKTEQVEQVVEQPAEQPVEQVAEHLVEETEQVTESVSCEEIPIDEIGREKMRQPPRPSVAEQITGQANVGIEEVRRLRCEDAAGEYNSPFISFGFAPDVVIPLGTYADGLRKYFASDNMQNDTELDDALTNIVRSPQVAQLVDTLAARLRQHVPSNPDRPDPINLQTIGDIAQGEELAWLDKQGVRTSVIVTVISLVATFREAEVFYHPQARPQEV